MSNNKGWVGFDLDSTIAYYDTWHGPTYIGPPIKEAIALLKKHLHQGHEVRIFTARVSHDGTPERMREAQSAARAIEMWCQEHIGVVLPVTNVKDYAMWLLYDDRAVQVVKNQGILVQDHVSPELKLMIRGNNF